MAEELENTQKPKVELIKHGQNGYVASEGGVKHIPALESGDPNKDSKAGSEEKKVSSPVVPVQGSAPPVKKPKVKKIITTPREGVPDASKGKPGGSSEQTAIKNTNEGPAAASSKPSSVPPARDGRSQDRGQGQNQRPAVSRGVTSFPVTQRPAAAAGRVGGKLVGPRHPREEGTQNRPPQFFHQQRPAAAAGRVGGKPVGPRHNEGNTNTNRQGNQGGPRPFGGQRHRGGKPGSPPGNQRQGSGFNPQRQGNTGRLGAPKPGSGMPLPTSPIIDNKGPVNKKTFKAKKPVYTRREKELEMEEKLLQTKKKIAHVANPVPKSIDIMEVISVSELARKMNLKASDLIQTLMNMGMMVTINQQIDADTASILAAEFGADVRIISLYDETLIETEADDESSMTSRPPVVTVMGHVDHGKTKLLDAIRSADVVSREFGGITQHIGAYTVDTVNGKITFLDTPGHEAFTRMRARGAQVTDIVVLVVAADDGVMPQTIEAINHAKEADVPIIVAVNKMDKPEANPDKVKSQLSELGLMPEDWGGQTMFVELSALRKEGIDKLVEAILLQAEILDIKANYNRAAEGKILESRIDHGRGIVATVMVEKGTLKIGDSFVRHLAGKGPGAL